MKENKKKVNEKMTREEYLYHNTELLLRKYRDVIWSIEVSAIQAQISFELEMDCKLEEFLEMSYDAGAELSGTQIQEQMRTLERNKKMLKIIEMAVGVLRKKKVNGETYYWILYFTYLSEKPCKNIDDLLSHIAEKTEMMCWRTYYKRRKEAVETLSGILWGYTAKDCLSILDEFV